MTWQNGTLTGLVVLLGIAQYAMMFAGINDLLHRPRVRGGNKIVWGLVILCVPFAGAIVYGWMGPASFLRRDQRTLIETSHVMVPDPLPLIAPSPSVPAPNITPLRVLRPKRPTHTVGSSANTVQSRPAGRGTEWARYRRTGS